MKLNTNRVFAVTEKKAFTLVEILIVIVVIAIVIVATIPSAMKKSAIKANKAKVAKAIVAYDKFIQTFTSKNKLNVSISVLDKLGRYNQMTLPPLVASSSVYTRDLPYGSYSYKNAKAQWAKDVDAREKKINAGECENVRKYFKVKEFYEGELENKHGKCVFKAGGLWFDTYNVTSTVVAFEPEILLDSNIAYIASDYNDVRAFYLTTTRDNAGRYKTNYTSENDILANQKKIKKAYDYAYNKESVKDLSCSKIRNKNCTNSKFVNPYYSMSRKGETGQFEEFYDFCGSNDISSCKCKYLKSEETEENITYRINEEDSEICRKGVYEYQRKYELSGDKNYCSEIIYNKKNKDFSENDFDPLKGKFLFGCSR